MTTTHRRRQEAELTDDNHRDPPLYELTCARTGLTAPTQCASACQANEERRGATPL